MGKKGDKRTGAARDAADAVVARLGALGSVSSRGMFGGYGIFADGVMFGLVNSGGEVFLRVDGASQGRYEAADAAKHGRMPYFTIPEAVLADDAALVEWAGHALAAAAAAKKK